MSIKKEDFTNRALALLLREQGLEADFEQKAGRKRLDVVAHVDGLRVVLEAETGFHKKAQAIKDADARLTQNLTTAVFAVCYPTGVTEETLQEAILTWTLRTRAGDTVGQWSEGGVSQLAQAVQQAPKSLSGADVAAQQLSDALDTAGRTIDCWAGGPRQGALGVGFGPAHLQECRAVVPQLHVAPGQGRDLGSAQQAVPQYRQQGYVHSPFPRARSADSCRVPFPKGLRPLAVALTRPPGPRR